jgi:hypothetical protein
MKRGGWMFLQSSVGYGTCSERDRRNIYHWGLREVKYKARIINTLPTREAVHVTFHSGSYRHTTAENCHPLGHYKYLPDTQLVFVTLHIMHEDPKVSAFPTNRSPVIWPVHLLNYPGTLSLFATSITQTGHEMTQRSSFKLQIHLNHEECRLLGYEIAVCTSQETHYVSVTEASRLKLCKIWGFPGGDYE